ncbi:MAG: DUF3750 domain-containing protein [Gammaproteobacteria bacterium]|nr:DUF3750 domain-containing protein [Gammaproteobacteria bacterium]MBU1441030.1 DUF3750 domain-containing protein [Gammaproteobacteria bacterium]MBU2289251.1 DUF3750 domain-containing protein [Gammaproteobacteria bacterium]MBU2410147.1 DUF3750 domain-containing protein [Gammaproteobacteria bacterium]
MPDAPSSPPARSHVPRWARWPLGLLCLLALLLLGPIGVLASGRLDLDTPWHMTSRESTGQAPSPSVERGAVVQVYGARIVRWRGAFGIHPWIAVKRAGAERYTTYHIVGWRARRGGDAMVTNEVSAPDLLWFGAYPQLLADHRGAQAEAMIDQIESAVAAYPWRDSYRLWPGPNSNTFVAWVARQVPALRLDLPPTAIGKDYLGSTTFIDHAPSGTGWQLSLLGLAGVTVARDEGLELNLLGLGFGIDVDDQALRLPGFGRLP